MTPKVFRPLLLVLVGLTAGAALLKAVSLAAPLPERQAPTSLNLPGYRVVPLGTSPGRGGRDLSHGSIRRFQLQPTNGAPALRLLLIPVRGRTSEDLQLAKFPAVVPEFALFQRQLSGEELAFGRGAADPPGAITRLQTCVTPGGSSGVTEETLGRQLHLERDAELFPSPLATKVKRLVGLIPNTRWECLAVQLQTPSPSDPQQLEQVWKLVRSALARSEKGPLPGPQGHLGDKADLTPSPLRVSGSHRGGLTGETNDVVRCYGFALTEQASVILLAPRRNHCSPVVLPAEPGAGGMELSGIEPLSETLVWTT
jgi:hypothetical protein